MLVDCFTTLLVQSTREHKQIVKYKSVYKIIFIILIFLSCHQEEKFNFYGKWQSLNEAGFIIEIDKNDRYDLYRKGKSMLEGLDVDELKIDIIRKTENWYRFKIEDLPTKKEFSKGRIEIVSKNRIRIYFHKHHDILDVADEFHRTKDLTSYEQIINKIYKLPEGRLE